jgi:putative membrane protein
MSMTNFLLTNLLNGLIAIVLLMIGYKVFDWLTPRWDTHEIFGQGFVSNGGIVVAAFLLGLAIVIASTAG